jgi:hypothetical protein
MRASKSSDSEVERPNIRPDSVRAAELRAQEILDALDGDVGGANELDIPVSLAPTGWEYQLKAASIAGMENRHHLLAMKRSGWTPVPASRHPHLMPAGYDGAIEIKGLLLMEKPKILTDRSREVEEREARAQLRNSEERLMDTPANTGPRDVRGKPIMDVKRELMRPIDGAK